MEIANPLYDNAFKYLMNQDKAARLVLSTILGKEVTDLQLSQQETVVEDAERLFTLYRLDFKARIIDENGKEETVLIELQKSKLPTNILRFRSYLGDTYMKRHQVVEEGGEEVDVAYPIISIYIIGYQLADIPAMAVKVNRKIIDVSSQKELAIESDFIELLTHTCYILQVRRLPDNRQTKIEKFMTFFNQAWVKEQRYILDLAEVPEGFEEVAEALQKPLLDEGLRRKLLAEQELEDYFSVNEAREKLLREQAEKERRLKEEERRLKEDERRQKEEERRLKEEERRLKVAALLKLAQKMLKYGEPVEDVMAETGLSREEIEGLKE